MMNGRCAVEYSVPGECLDSPGIVYISGGGMFPESRNGHLESCGRRWKDEKYFNLT